MKLNELNVQEMNEKELETTDGGILVGILFGALYLGIYNGYHDTQGY